MADAANWTKLNFHGSLTALPFSFIYGGTPSAQLLRSWKSVRSNVTLDGSRTQETTTFTDPKTHLQVRCVMVRYNDYPVVEWTLYFKNTGSDPTPLLEKIQSLDTSLDPGQTREYVLHYSIGSPATAEDYEPLEAALSSGTEKHFAPTGGRPTDGAFPYFDLESKGPGVIIAVGWPGQWAADFSRNKDSKVHVRAGQELTHFKLSPGEEVRTPLTALLFYKGEWIRAQNIWRRWMIAHNMPRPAGKLPSPQLAGGSCPYYGPFVGNNQDNQELFIRRYFQEQLKLDDWWIDAGWYPNNGKWTNTGTWEVDTKRFPNGLKAVSDYAHARGAKLIVWFEPERVTPGTWLYEQHPEWLLKPPANSDYPPIVIIRQPRTAGAFSISAIRRFWTGSRTIWTN
jgi:alpha-galactosidase